MPMATTSIPMTSTCWHHPPLGVLHIIETSSQCTKSHCANMQHCKRVDPSLFMSDFH